MELTKGMKSSACEENKGHTDLNPMVVVGLEIKDDEGNEGLGGQVIEMCLSNGDHPVDALPKMLNDLGESGLTKFRFLMFVVEGFARRLSNNEEGKKELAKLTQDGDYERGALEKDFHENPLSNVEEGLIATAFAWTGESATMSQFYKYGDNGLPVYEDDADVFHYDATEPQQGRVPDVFHAFVKYCQMVEMSKHN
jgi:hypothetical protein